ncbi:MAG: hypothetical protein HUJ51_01640 [Eggerthellaceae bacterium]|nr:hypothetical protein [Eggerthellaceae bacterium]
MAAGLIENYYGKKTNGSKGTVDAVLMLKDKGSGTLQFLKILVEKFLVT